MRSLRPRNCPPILLSSARTTDTAIGESRALSAYNIHNVLVQYVVNGPGGFGVSASMGGVPMQQQELEEERRRTAEAVRAACLRAALEGYERAGISGLCEAGRWEMAIDSIQSLDVATLVRELANSPNPVTPRK